MPGVGYSKLKKNKFGAWLLNKMFTSDAFKPLFGWAKIKDKDTLQSDINITDASNNLSRVVETKYGTPLDQPLVDAVYELIHAKTSNVVIARDALKKAEHKRTAEEIQCIQRYLDSSSWSIPGTTLLHPTAKEGLRTLLNLRDLYLMIAIHETVNPVIRKRSGKVPEHCTDEHIMLLNKKRRDLHNSQNAGPVCSGDVLKNLQAMHKKADGATAQGETAKQACEAAMQFVMQYGDSIFHPTFLNYDNFIKPFTQIAYQFNGGYTHHGVYLGSNVVIEVLNLDSGESVFSLKSTIRGYITFTHIFDFMKRARNNPSEVFAVEYNNPFPDHVIRDRALWSLGRFPHYHIAKENCESFANWVCSNSFEAQMCLVLKNTPHVYPSGVLPFHTIFSNIAALPSLPLLPTSPLLTSPASPRHPSANNYVIVPYRSQTKSVRSQRKTRKTRKTRKYIK
jgi:hypothetical protein